MSHSFDYENAVTWRHANAAQQREPALCCPGQYGRELLKVRHVLVVDKGRAKQAIV